jgi:phosphatidylserine decarboxylase
VPVAAILVASIRLHFLDVLFHLRYNGANPIDCDAHFTKGQEMGWFQHGSTIVVLAPSGFRLASNLDTGSQVKMGQALMHGVG